MRPLGGARRPMASTASVVTSVTRLTPRMIRVRLGGEGLRGSAAVPGQSVKIYVPDPAGLLVGRDYTVRDADPDQPSMDIDFVLHGDGPAANWARQVRPGQGLEFVGPSGRYRPDPGADWHLFGGDESALPAILAMVGSLPADALAVVYLEIADSAEEQPVSGPTRAEVHWLHRAESVPGANTLLEDALRAAPLPKGQGRIWLAGHTPTVRRIRAHLLAERGVDRRLLYVRGYWDRSGQ